MDGLKQFEQALRDLAELFPEKYGMWNRESLGGEKEFVILGSQDKLIPIFLITQDDIDSILAEIGWVYTQRVLRSKFASQKHFTLEYRYYCLNVESGEYIWNEDIFFDTKIESARQALIEVVRIEKEKRK
jgi:hypothetical protein